MALHIFSLPQQATLPLPTFFTICGRGFQPADAGGRIEPGVERQRNPRIWCKYASSPRSGRQLFVMRHFIIIEIGPMAVARFAGWDDTPLSYLGFRCAPPQQLCSLSILKTIKRFYGATRVVIPPRCQPL